MPRVISKSKFKAVSFRKKNSESSQEAEPLHKSQKIKSAVNLSGVKSKNFTYDVAFESQTYHIVKNRESHEIEVVPNESVRTRQLPSFKMELQSHRKVNLSQAHDMRFESINRDP